MINQQIKVPVILLLFLLTACSSKDEGKMVLFEMKNFDKELQECIHYNLNDKWINWRDDSFTLHSLSEKTNRKLHADKITFKDITDNEPNEIKYETEKLILNISKSGAESDSIIINVQQFLFESNGQWRRVLNMGNFTIANENDICKRILDLAIGAQYK